MQTLLLVLSAVGLAGTIGLSIAFASKRKAVAKLAVLLESCRQERAQIVERMKPVVDADTEATRVTKAAEADVIAARNELVRLKALAESRGTQYITQIKAEATRVRKSAEEEMSAVQQELARLKAEADRLRAQYATGLGRYQALEIEVRSLEEDLENVAVGLYRPHFTYADSESYKAAIEGVRAKQKAMIKNGQAALCGTAWTVEGSARDGERMIKQYEKLLLRAFNAEAEAAIANVTWNNFRVMKTRIEKGFDALNKLGTVMHVTLSTQYRGALLEELQLVFEAAEKKQQEREEQRRIRTEQREEERVQRQLMREREDAEQDEARYQKALEKAKKEIGGAQEAERNVMLARIRGLEAELAAAHDRKERAIAQAQLTKVGHVYIISNVGAFGKNVLKIGLTRRLDPAERVHELGDASVPFPFDTHAMLYSENAPELEASLHKRFWERRLNWSNDRKEFFNVSVDEVTAALEQLGVKTDVLRVPEAREFRETVAALEQGRREKATGTAPSAAPRFPEDPFAASS